MPEASLTFPAELDSVGAARRFLRETLRGWDNGNYDFGAPLVLTELATNATLHARTPYTVLLRLEPTHLLVQVIDSSPKLPHMPQCALTAATGRGIKLVHSFSATWGTRPTPQGKVVWAHVRPDESSMRTLPAVEQEVEQEREPAAADPLDQPPIPQHENIGTQHHVPPAAA